MTRVIFTYDEVLGKWDPIVEGEPTPLSASQAFNAVVISCQQLNPELLIHNRVETIKEGFRIIPAV